MRRSRILVQKFFDNTESMELLPCYEKEGNWYAVRNGQEYEIRPGTRIQI